jgi:hypothetical protein
MTVISGHAYANVKAVFYVPSLHFLDELAQDFTSPFYLA